MKKLFYLAVFLIIGTLLMQGFQCASPEMTTAKLAVKNKDWQKAKQYLEKEIEKNQANGEAWIMLVETLIKLDENNKQSSFLDEATTAILTGERYITGKELVDRIPYTKYSVFAACYNSGIEYLNTYISNPDKKADDFNKSINNFNNCLKLRPKNPEIYRFIGMAYEAKGDIPNTNLNYNKFADMLKNEVALAKEKNINIKMERTEALKNLGKPKYSNGFKIGDEKVNDSLMVDAYEYQGKELLVYSVKEASNPFILEGWRLDLPKDLTNPERFQPFSFSTAPYFSLAQNYFESKEWSKALDNVFSILYLDPKNTDANTALILIYDSQGKKDESLKYIQELVKKNPNNPSYLVQYADLLQQLEKFDESIVQYENALKIDPKNDNALRNVASAYKNKVLMIQKTQQDKLSKDQNYKPNPDEYLPLLKKSAEYFEQCRKSFKFSQDFEVLGELGEIYTFTKDKDKQQYIIAELESLEQIIQPDKLERYYYVLLRLYDRIEGGAKESAKIQEKINNLKK